MPDHDLRNVTLKSATDKTGALRKVHCIPLKYTGVDVYVEARRTESS